MKKRKFMKVNTEKIDLINTIKRLKNDIVRRDIIIKRLFAKRNEKNEVSREEIYMICNSYESGFGHGVANDGLDLSRTPHSEKHLGDAYQIGYKAGNKRYTQATVELI